MRISFKIGVVAAAAIVTTVGVGAFPAGAATAGSSHHPRIIVVHPGTGTISRAVAKAKPGDTLLLKRGTFRDSVTITFTLTIKGQGNRTVIRPPAKADTPCGPDGLCAIGVVDSQGNPNFHHPVRNVTVANLRVTGFSQGTGVDGFNTKGYHVKRVYADHNGGYGIARFASTNSVFEKNHASFNGEAGLYMGDSPNANSILRDNVADHNGFGLFMRDSTRLTAVGNTVFGNCVGILALNSGQGAPFDKPAGDYLITGNKAIANDKACPADEGPALSGIGIALAGVHNTLVTRNTVLFNRPGGPSAFSGGIVLASTKAEGGSDPNFNIVVRNTAKHNQPADIFSDGTGKGNIVKRNNCNTAIPGNRGFCSSH